MQYYNFDRLIAKYSRTFTVVVKSKSEFDDKGDEKQQNATQYEIQGALMAMSERKVHNSNGIYNSKDKALYMTKSIDRALLGSEVIFKGDTYKIEEMIEADDSEFTGVYHYVLRHVSVFEGKNDD